MSSGLPLAQSNAVLHLVQRLVHLANPTATDAPTSLQAAMDGTTLYRALSTILPSSFPLLSPTTATSACLESAVSGMTTVLQGAVEGLDGTAFDFAKAFPQLAFRGSAVSPARQLSALAQCFTITTVLCGSSLALQQLKQLSRDDQMTLSNLAKSQLQALSLKPRPRQAPTTDSSIAAAQPQPTSANASSSVSPPPPQITTAAPASSSATAALPPGTADMITDVAYYHNATVQLRKELTTSQDKVAGLEARCQAAEQERDTWSRKYQLLLGNDGAASPAEASVSVSLAGSGSADNASTVALLKQRCAEKDGTIDTLKSKVEEQTTRMAAFKETLGMHEVALQALRRKLKLAEEGVMAKSTECRRLQEALSVSEDKLSVQLKARTECENTVESLRSQLTVMQLTLQEREAMDGNDNSHMPGNLSGSFASNGSIDRVVVLENEVDEVRAQRDALQKQLSVLQRQVATLPPPVANADAVSDTLKAHVRLLEKEKEDLRQQLSAAMAQVEAVATQSAQSNAFSTPPRRSSSRFSPVGEDGDDDNGTDGPASATRGGGVEGLAQRKQRNNTRRDQTILSSLLLEYGYQNLLLQQHNVLLHRDALDAAEARACRIEENDQVLGGPSGVRARGGGRAFAGSFLTRQRREIEEGLLESIIHGHSESL